MKQFTSFLDILAAAGITPEQFNEQTKDFTPGEKGDRKVALIAKVLNEGEKGEPIYYPWFWKRANKKKPSGVGLSFFATVRDYSDARVPARLKYKNRELAEYAGKTFIAEYEEQLLLF